MPTENRSSNTEMVSFPRELSDDLAELIATRARVCGGGAFEIWEAICEGFAAPVQQPHPEPIAWMVGTAFWWTKEEAERDAADTGLPIVGLGPMAGAAPGEQHQGEPVAIVTIGANDKEVIEPLSHDLKVGTELYTHADPGEVERLRAALKFYADRGHFAEDIGSDWDNVSGEPANVLWHEQEAWFVEDGSIARAALLRKSEQDQG